jgi:hypothetical protein
MAERIKPIENDHPGNWHAERFIEFARAKDAIGEPTPHMRVVDYLCKDLPLEEQTWRAGLYLAGYSVLTGEGIWNTWSWERYQREGKDFKGWLQENWKGVHKRKPRRCMTTYIKFADCVESYAKWAANEFPRLRAKKWDDPQAEYNEWWESADGIYQFGRYINIRLLELNRRRGHMQAHLYDIRAVGAHSPIRCLMLLRPDRVAELGTGEQGIVNAIAQEVKFDLKTRGIDMSYFIFATLLCEYRSGYEGGGDYAGNQHDEELEYSYSRYADYWRGTGLQSRLYEARAAIDPHECLGEIQGWKKRRLDVAGWMRSRGVVWSDLKYDYLKSVAADEPVIREWF